MSFGPVALLRGQEILNIDLKQMFDINVSDKRFTNLSEDRSMVAKDVTQTRLLEVAGQVFAEKGFDGATVREICQRADANIAAVNYYFRDKEKLYIEAVKSACQ